MFENETVPRSEKFNQKDTSSYPLWLRSLDPLTQQNISVVDRLWRNRLRSLQAVDEMIRDIMKKLDDLEVTDETYIFYTADNGYHLGAHRMMAGKETA
jgi:N-acetylglucosamine-6-sulfatase